MEFLYLLPIYSFVIQTILSITMDLLLRYSKHYTHPLEKSEIVRVAKDSCKSMEFQRVKVITHSGPLSPGGASKCYYKNLEGFPNQV